MMNSKQFYNFIKEAYQNSGQKLNPKFKGQFKKGFNTNWWDAVNRIGMIQNYYFSVSNGTDRSQTYLSLGYKNQNGSIITTQFKRLTLKLNSRYDVTSNFTIGVHLGIARDRISDTGTLISFSEILDADPFTPVINPNVSKSDPNYKYNKYAPPEWSFNPNPVGLLKRPDRSTKRLNLYGNVYGKYDFTVGLDYSVKFDFENNSRQFSLFLPRFHSQFDELNLANRIDKFRRKSKLTINNGADHNYAIQQRLHYKKGFKNQSIEVMVAMKYQHEKSESVNAFKRNTPGNRRAFRVFNAATESAQLSGGKLETSILSYLGRVNYSYKNRYYLTVNFRADGSSIFKPGNRWGYFPSFSLAWRVSDESFFKKLNISSVISNLKIRFGWGQTGNQNINRNAIYTLIGTSPTDIWYFGTGFSHGYVPVNKGNSDLQWETSEQINFGIDMGLFNNKLSLTANYYVKKTQNMLLQVPLPFISGYPNNPFSNAGNMKNTGYSVSVNFNEATGSFNYSVGLNISGYNNTVTSLGNGGIPIFGAVSKTVVGGPISRFYGYKYLGIFQSQEEINNYVGPDGNLIQPAAKPGDFKFADLNNDGLINAQDRTFIGNPHPDLIYGFHLSVAYHRFNITALFQGTIGNDIYNGGRAKFVAPGFHNALAAAYTEAWRPGKSNASFPRITLNDSNHNFRTSSWFVENGSYLRLRNLRLSYNISVEGWDVLRNFGIYISASNLFTLTNYSGLDPSLGINNPLNLGYDALRYPVSRRFLFGINLKF